MVVVLSLDRLGRNLKHLLDVMEELSALSVAFVSLREGVDATTPRRAAAHASVGSLRGVRAARIQERVRAGLARARRQGKRLGRPPRRMTARELKLVAGLSMRAAARELRVSPSQQHRARRAQASSQRDDVQPRAE